NLWKTRVDRSICSTFLYLQSWPPSNIQESYASRAQRVGVLQKENAYSFSFWYVRPINLISTPRVLQPFGYSFVMCRNPTSRRYQSALVVEDDAGNPFNRHVC